MESKPHPDPECSCSECLEWLNKNIDWAGAQADRMAAYEKSSDDAMAKALDRIP